MRPDWDAYQKWPGPFVNGTANFVLPEDHAKGSLPGIYHAGVTGWAALGQTLYGVLWRNVPFENKDQPPSRQRP